MDNGVLPDFKIEDLIENGWIRTETPIEDGQISSDTLDLRLSATAWRIPVSFRTGRGQRIEELIERNRWGGPIDLSQEALLDLNCKYIIKLQESLHFGGNGETKTRLQNIFGKASNKSSFGRINAQVKLVSDSGYDITNNCFTGNLYAEVTPRSFPIIVRAGDRLNQIRFNLGNPRLRGFDINVGWPGHKFIYDAEGKPVELEDGMIDEDGLLLHLGLEGDVVAYRAKKGVKEPIDVRKKNHYDIRDFWDTITREDGSLRLIEDEFYIASTREVLALDSRHTADLAEYDLERAGQLRAQYARFINSGWNGQLTLEIIPHDSIELQDDQPICRLLLYRLLEAPEKQYGQNDNYHKQRGPQLAKFFKKAS